MTEPTKSAPRDVIADVPDVWSNHSDYPMELGLGIHTADRIMDALAKAGYQIAAKAAERETADPRTTLHTVIADIRESSGLGARPMLGELAGEIGKLRERADQVAALTKERDDLGQACAELERRVQEDYAKSIIADQETRIAKLEAALAARPAAGAVGEDAREALARWSRARIALNRTKINTPECHAAFTELGSAEAALVNVALLPASPSGEGWRDIESAPKDGTVVDLWCSPPGISSGPGRTPDCWYYRGHWWRYDEAHGDAECKARVANVTHWRPLPSPPRRRMQDDWTISTVPVVLSSVRKRLGNGQMDQTATEDRRPCTCHPDDQPPVPCPRKYALTHCRAADLGRRLRHAIATAMNDDLSEAGTAKRTRHFDRLDAMSAAADFLEDRW